MSQFITFMQGTAGRLLRIAAGIVLIVLGAFIVQGVWGYVLVLVGLFPLAAGLIGVCFIAPLVGYTLTGERRSAHAHT